ncbi:MAG: 8-oxo-dGTP diphosphatase [Clostridia bacterium]|nr:8-oxo-dGTP diphosphatase [Clostridia bacterium]MBQ3869889.1 8-oxo-dGTP diphosphatase [Clostridia bacterium]
MGREITAEVTNMIMIQDPQTKKVVVLNRRLSWKGISFPGGHVEKNESFYESAVREAYEETGLRVRDLRFCGVINWECVEDGSRYIVMLYKTDKYEGELKPGTEEGENFFVDIEELKKRKTDNRIEDYLPLFLDDNIFESYEKYSKTNDEKFPVAYFGK